MNIQLERNDRKYVADLKSAVSIAIDLQFDGPQPNHFGVEPATSQPITVGDFIGSTSQGAGCNVQRVTLVPHCNGTHTESVGHIVNDEVAVANLACQSLFLAAVITVEPDERHGTESYTPDLNAGDKMVTAAAIQQSCAQITSGSIDALIVRTTPNGAGKLQRVYGAACEPAFFSTEAIDVVIKLGVSHLLVDLPSIDRMHDDGLLSNHHRFWNVEPGGRALTAAADQHKTITELIFVPDAVPDGYYLLNLQIAPFISDAAPSRPIISSVTEVKP